MARVVGWMGALLLLATGCGPPPGIDVSGKVQLDKKPLRDAAIVFYPEGTTEGMGGHALSDAEGKYSIKAVRGKGIEAGRYRVVISHRLNPDGSRPDPKVPPIESQARETLPPRYSDRSSSILEATVAADKKVHDFELSSKKD